jgi:hypothetical protein
VRLQLVHFDALQLDAAPPALRQREAAAKDAADAHLAASRRARQADTEAAYEAQRRHDLGDDEYERRYFADSVRVCSRS